MDRQELHGIDAEFLEIRHSAARSVSPVGRNIKDGVVRSTSDNRWLERTTPSAPAKEASRLFLDGRSHPSFAKAGSLPAPAASSATRVRAKRGACPLLHLPALSIEQLNTDDVTQR